MLKKNKKEDKRDHRERSNKIIHNNWNQVDFDEEEISFNPIDLVDTTDFLDELHLKMVTETIHLNIEKSDFQYLNVLVHKVDKEKNSYTRVRTLKKNEINELFAFLIKQNKTFSILDIYYCLCNYFDIDYSKFFDSLSNIYKSRILKALGKEKKSIFNTNFKLH